MGDALDLKQIFFTNLQLLGFDVGAEEARNKIPFNKKMFDLPNKRGAEVVLHFLFDRLNPIMCREEFRDCWPITDKKQEQQFRRTCHNWLVNISKEEPDSHLPRIVASLFMSPGGDKFYQLLFHFTTYVLQHVITKENGMKEKDHLRYPVLTQQNVALGDVIAKAIQCAVVRHRKKFIEEAQTTLVLNREWKEYTNELVKEYRRLSKDIRETDHNMRSEVYTASEKGLARGSPMVKRTKSRMYEYDFDPQSIKRSQRVQQVRDMWKQLEEFYIHEASEREVIESIVDRTLNKHKIDAGEINIKVPDLLLRECEEEIRRRHVDNTFHGGKLNLVSLVQLWNLCLHLYIERLHQVGVPKFDSDIKKVTNQVHTNRAYLANAKNIREKMAESLPDLKKSVDELRARIDSQVCVQTTPQTIRTTNVGLGLVEPSPPVSFTPSHGTTGQTPKGIGVEISPEEMSTPEAASRIAQGISSAIKIGPNKLFQGSPVYAPRLGHGGQPTGANKVPTTKLPRKTKASAKTVDVRGQLQSTPTKIHAKDVITIQSEPQSWMSQQAERGLSDTSRRNLDTSDNSAKSIKSLKSGHSVNSEDGDATPVNLSRHLDGDETPLNLSRSDKGSPRSYKSSGSTKGTPHRGVRRSPSDIVADEIMGEGNVLSPVQSGQEAFVTHNEIERSPPTSKAQKSPTSPSDILVDQMLGTTPTSTIRSRDIGSRLLNGSPLRSEVKKMWQEAVSAENSPGSLKSDISFHSKKSNESPRSVRSKKSNQSQTWSHQSPRSAGSHQSPRSTGSPKYADSPERPHSPVAEILNSFHDSDDRPHSPVAEILDNLDKIPSSDALETLTKQEEALSDLNSPRDNSFHSYNSDGDAGYDEDIQEVPEIYRQPNEMKSMLSPHRSLVDSLIKDTEAFLSKDKIPRSPLSEDIRKMFKEALAETENSSPRSMTSNRSRTYLMRDEYTESNVFGLCSSLDTDQQSGSETNERLSGSVKEKEQMKIKQEVRKSKKGLDFLEETKSDISLDEILRRQNLTNDLQIGDENLDDIEMPNLCSDGTFDEMFEALIKNKKSAFSPHYSDNLASLRSNEFDSVRTGSLADKVPKKQKFPLIDVDFDVEQDFSVSHHENREICENDVNKISCVSVDELNSEDLQNENFLLPEDEENVCDNGANSKQQDNRCEINGRQESVESELLKDVNLLNDSNNSLLNFDFNSHNDGGNESKGSAQKSEDDLDLLESLDDSFVPLKEGFHLAGATPVKNVSTSSKPEIKDGGEKDILALYQKLKQATSQVQKDYLFDSGSH